MIDRRLALPPLYLALILLSGCSSIQKPYYSEQLYQYFSGLLAPVQEDNSLQTVEYGYQQTPVMESPTSNLGTALIFTGFGLSLINDNWCKNHGGKTELMDMRFKDGLEKPPYR